MKTSDMRTKRKQKNEANADEAEKLIQDYLDQFDNRGNLKTYKILREYIEAKTHPEVERDQDQT